MSRFPRLSILLAVIAVLAAACGGNVQDLAVGDCFDDPSDGATEISNVEMVDCNEPHDNEVFYVYEVDSLGTEESYFNDCLGAFTGYVGSDYATSEVFIGMVYPTDDSFSQGDRSVVCIGYLDGAKLSSSIAGSGR